MSVLQQHPLSVLSGFVTAEGTIQTLKVLGLTSNCFGCTQPVLLGWKSRSLSSLYLLKALHPPTPTLPAWAAPGHGEGWQVPSCTALSRAASRKWGGTEPCEQGQHHIPSLHGFFTGSCFWTCMKRNLLATGEHSPQNPHPHSRWSQNYNKMEVSFLTV